ncbi:MAG TPA: energy transducer TonB [Candidatus Kapabacteria bacterium]
MRIVILIICTLFILDSSYCQLPAKPIVDVRTVIVYPKEELKAGTEGMVRAELGVNIMGKVTKCKIKESSGKSFTDAVMAACKKAEFEPARDSLGHKVESWYPVMIIFKPTPQQIAKANEMEVVDINDLNDKMQGNTTPEILTKIDDLIDYPMAALRANLEGKVEASVYVNNKGLVDSCQIISSTDRIFEASAVSAIKKMRYAPPKRGGMPMPFRYRQTVDFLLGKK